jgi:hypothetical protein
MGAHKMLAKNRYLVRALLRAAHVRQAAVLSGKCRCGPPSRCGGPPIRPFGTQCPNVSSRRDVLKMPVGVVRVAGHGLPTQPWADRVDRRRELQRKSW